MARPSLIDKLVLWLKQLGALALTGMIVMTVVDVITRSAGSPVFGLVEIVSLLAVIVLACAMPVTHAENGHVGVALLVNRFKPRTQNAIDAVTGLAGGVLFLVVAWQMYLYGQTMRKSGEVSMSMQLPTHFLIWVVAVAFLVLALVVFKQALVNLRKAVG